MSDQNDKKFGKLTSIPGGRSGQDPGAEGEAPANTPPKVIDFAHMRAIRSLENRRTVERHFLTYLVDAIVDLEGGKELSLEVVEVSEGGCSFRVTPEKAKLLPQGQIITKLYFSRDSYLLVGLSVANINPEIGHGGSPALRYGCKIDESFASTEAFVQFVRFIESFSTSALRDTKHASSS